MPIERLGKDRWLRDLEQVLRTHRKADDAARIEFGSYELRCFLKWANGIAAGRPAPHIEELTASVLSYGDTYCGMEVPLSHLRGCYAELRGFQEEAQGA